MYKIWQINDQTRILMRAARLSIFNLKFDTMNGYDERQINICQPWDTMDFCHANNNEKTAFSANRRVIVQTEFHSQLHRQAYSYTCQVVGGKAR